MSLIQRIKRRTKLPSSRKFSADELAVRAWGDDWLYGWDLRDQYYPYSAHDEREKRAYFAALPAPGEETNGLR